MRCMQNKKRTASLLLLLLLLAGFSADYITELEKRIAHRLHLLRKLMAIGKVHCTKADENWLLFHFLFFESKWHKNKCVCHLRKPQEKNMIHRNREQNSNVFCAWWVNLKPAFVCARKVNEEEKWARNRSITNKFHLTSGSCNGSMLHATAF